MKKIILIAISILSIMTLIGCAVKVTKTSNNTNKETTVNDTAVETEVNNNTTVEETQNNNNRGKDIVKAELKIKDYGVIELELYKDIAPVTVENFVNLVKNDFYDGLTFHRIINGFMIQGGDPLGNGRGGSKDKIFGEFASNGFNNTLPHDRGVISMARSDDPNSASSQFFIMHQKAPHLDGDYAAFGKVTSGIEVVDEICENVIPVDRNGTVLKEDQPVIEYIKIIE